MSLKNKTKQELINEINELKEQLRFKNTLPKNKGKEIDPETFETVPFGYVLFDEKKIYYINKTAKDLFKLPNSLVKDPSKLSIYQFIEKEFHAQIRKMNKEVMKGKFFNGVESVCRDYKGKKLNIESFAKTVQYQGKKILQGFFRDISDKKNIQTELIKTKDNFKDIVSKIDE